jgi:hydroxyethylthiazole kinase-like uncharacterized protein yjeF
MTTAGRSERIDQAWRRDHPLPAIHDGLDKDARGRALLLAGSTLVPGAPRLAAEAVLRVGAGKVRIATIAAQAPLLGIMMPEAAVVGIPGDLDGEPAAGTVPILTKLLDRCDVLVAGCGMNIGRQTAEMILSLIEAAPSRCPVLLDAGAMTALSDEAKRLSALKRRVVMTPHHGELAQLLDCDRAAIGRDPPNAARRAAKAFGATIVLKDHETVIATGTEKLLRWTASTPGLGTAGSGDVLAGIIGGLLARGADPLVAAGWGVWLHSAAGGAAARRFGTIGFLAGDMLRELPAIVSSHSPTCG